MNIFNKTLLAISLAFVIPLSTHANWFSNIAHAIVDKKKTIVASAILGGGLSYLAAKLVNTLHFEDTMYQDYPGYDKLTDAIKAPKKFKSRNNYPQTKKVYQKIAIISALCITAGLIYKAHKRNSFNENSKA